MLDLGLSFFGSVARDPNALAVVDGELRLTYAQGTGVSPPWSRALIRSDLRLAITE